MQKRQLINLLFLLAGAFGLAAQEPAVAPPLPPEKAPSFPGGEPELLKFLNTNIQYPQLARENGIQGTVVLSFIVEKDGSISGITTIKDIGGGCDQEAARVAALMPHWIPGEANGKPVKVRFTLPVRFRLEDDAPPPPPPPTTDEIVAPPPPVKSDSVSQEYVMVNVQKMPVFPGGEDSLKKFLAANVQYPKAAKRSGIQGNVIMSFMVEKDGSLNDIKIIKDIGGGCGQEAARVVALMPRWTPSEANGKPVKLRITLPVPFKL